MGKHAKLIEFLEDPQLIEKIYLYVNKYGLVAGGKKWDISLYLVKEIYNSYKMTEVKNVKKVEC